MARSVRTALTLLGVAGVLAGGIATAWAHQVFVVDDPRNLQLVDLRDTYLGVNERLTERTDLLTPVRNAAMRRSIKGWGITRPSQGDLRVGSVVRVEDNGQLAFAVVLQGDIDAPLVCSRLEEKYRRHWKRNGREAAVETHALKGWKGIRMPYIERKGLFTALHKGQTIFLASTPPDRPSLVGEVADVLDGRTPKNEPPAKVQIRYAGAMTERERGKVAEFVSRTLKGRLREARRGFQKLYERIGGDVDEDELKTTNEKLNELFTRMIDFDVTLNYEQGPSANDDLYQVTYHVKLPTAEDAQRMKELLLEKAVFYRENNPSRAIGSTLDSVTVDCQGPTLTVAGEVDTREKLHDFAYAYTAFLMSYVQADKFLGLAPW